MKKEISLEKLALMVGKGFSQMDKRFEQIDKRFEDVDNRFDMMENRFSDFDRRLGFVESDLKQIKDNVMGYVYDFELKALKKRVSVLEVKVK